MRTLNWWNMKNAATINLLSRSVGGLFRAHSTAPTEQITNAKTGIYGNIRKTRPFEEMPEVKGLPIIGPILDYMPWRGFEITRIDKHWVERHRQYGEIYKEKVPGKEVVVYCRTPGDTETMFRSDGRSPNRPYVDSLVRIKESAKMPESLITLNGEEWNKCRRIANSSLLVNKMVWKYTKQQREVAEDLVKYIRRNIGDDGEVPDFASALKKWGFEMSGTFIFDGRLGCLDENPNEEIVELANNVGAQLEFVANSLFGWNMWHYFRTDEIKKLDKAVNDMMKTMNEIIAREHDSSVEKDSILNRLMNAKELTQKERLSMLFDIFGASGESTSQAAAFMLYGLTLNPEVQEKLRDEVSQLSDEDVRSGRMVGNLKYVNAFLKEAYRLFPLTLAYSRFYNKDIVLSGYNIPAGTQVINTNTATLARSSKYFYNPDEMIPERWMDDENPVNKFAIVGPFSLGPRACVGRRLAMQELRLLLIEVLKEYRVEYHHEPIEALFRSIAFPSHPPQFKFIPLQT